MCAGSLAAGLDANGAGNCSPFGLGYVRDADGILRYGWRGERRTRDELAHSTTLQLRDSSSWMTGFLFIGFDYILFEANQAVRE
jgi:hypothetical protein